MAKYEDFYNICYNKAFIYHELFGSKSERESKKIKIFLYKILNIYLVKI
jgi:hypothetical protein